MVSAKAKIMSEKASSMPITARTVLVSGPLARYCWMTATVAAGAVAEDTAPRTSENDGSRQMR